MKRRSGSGSVSNDDLQVAPPGERSAEPPRPEHKTRLEAEEAKALHERAMADVKKGRRHRNETLRAAVLAVVKSAAPKILVVSGVFSALIYDSVHRSGSWVSILEQFVALFGLIFTLLFWAWNRH